MAHFQWWNLEFGILSGRCQSIISFGGEGPWVIGSQLEYWFLLTKIAVVVLDVSVGAVVPVLDDSCMMDLVLAPPMLGFLAGKNNMRDL